MPGIINSAEKLIKPIGTAFKNLSTPRKIAVGAGAAGVAGVGALAGRATKGNTTINKIAEDSFIDELSKIANGPGCHKPVSEAQRRFMFTDTAKRKGITESKAEKMSKKVEGKDLPMHHHEKTSSDVIAEQAFVDEFQKLSKSND